MTKLRDSTFEEVMIANGADDACINMLDEWLSAEDNMMAKIVINHEYFMIRFQKKASSSFKNYINNSLAHSPITALDTLIRFSGLIPNLESITFTPVRTDIFFRSSRDRINTINGAIIKYEAMGNDVIASLSDNYTKSLSNMILSAHPFKTDDINEGDIKIAYATEIIKGLMPIGAPDKVKSMAQDIVGTASGLTFFLPIDLGFWHTPEEGGELYIPMLSNFTNEENRHLFNSGWWLSLINGVIDTNAFKGIDVTADNIHTILDHLPIQCEVRAELDHYFWQNSRPAVEGISEAADDNTLKGFQI